MGTSDAPAGKQAVTFQSPDRALDGRESDAEEPSELARVALVELLKCQEDLGPCGAPEGTRDDGKHVVI